MLSVRTRVPSSVPVCTLVPVLTLSWLAIGWTALTGQEPRAPEIIDPAARAAAVRYAQSESPSPAEVLGYELGERFTDHAGVVRYMEALATASPRVQLREYGESVEGRRLVQVVIAREDVLARLDEVMRANRELAEPSTPEARARAIARTNLAVIYFTYGVHGNESSSSEAAMYTAWDLAREAANVAGVLDSAVVVIDPVANPDGRDRYVNWFRQATGVSPNPSPAAWEHWEPWPGGRVNHYLFDLNRDWAWMTQPETRARLTTWLYWTPQVHVDFHEMGWESTYFFFPATPPINPIYPDHILEWGRIFGEANAAAFDDRGWPYYTAESFDLFYPGYGDTWPSLLGAIGMTYEQAGHSRAGLAIERDDGMVLTLRERAEGHRTTGSATLRAAAGRKSQLLEGYAEFHRTVDEGLPDVLLVPGEDPSRADALVALLRAQGIRVERAARAFRADAEPHTGFAARRDFGAGSYRVPARQSRGRLAITLLQPETFLDATFSYDISAWSLPYAYGVEAHSLRRVPDAGWQPVDDAPRVALAAGGVSGEASALFARPWPGVWSDRPSGAPAAQAETAGPVEDGDGEGGTGAVPSAGEPYGFLLLPGAESWPGVIRFVEAGGRAVALAQEFTLGGRTWPAGTIFLPRHGTTELTERVRASGLERRAEPIQSGRATEGRDLGTNRSYAVRLPRLALLTGDGVSATSFGAHWYFFERTAGLRFDAIPVDRLRSIDLVDYDVLVVPEIGEDVLSSRDLDDIETWVRRGGTVIGVGSGARRIAEPVAGIKVREREDDDDGETERALLGREARDLDRWERQIPGTVLSVQLDPDHPLAFGAGIDGDPDRLFVLHRGGLVFEPETAFESAGYFPAELEKVSGVITDENLERLAHGSWLATRGLGRGRVVLFADDPLFRHFWYSTFQPYLNAIMVGPRI